MMRLGIRGGWSARLANSWSRLPQLVHANAPDGFEPAMVVELSPPTPSDRRSEGRRTASRERENVDGEATCTKPSEVAT